MISLSEEKYRERDSFFQIIRQVKMGSSASRTILVCVSKRSLSVICPAKTRKLNGTANTAVCASIRQKICPCFVGSDHITEYAPAQMDSCNRSRANVVPPFTFRRLKTSKATEIEIRAEIASGRVKG